MSKQFINPPLTIIQIISQICLEAKELKLTGKLFFS
jgi:hypothetical protein